MAESIKTTVVENLPENAAPGDADYIITAQKNILKKTKIAQLVNVFKEKLGINTLNTKITFVNQVYKGTGVAYIYINPPDTNNDYYLIEATNGDSNAC